MSAAPDVNDRHLNGELPSDFRVGAIPMSEAAKRKAESEPRVLTVKEILVDSMTRAFSTERTSQCTTGHHELDLATGGLRPGHVWVFGAETSWGKSSWLVSVVDENLKRGRRVLIVSSEDSETLYGDRLLARRARVNYTRLRDSCLTPDEMKAVTGVIGTAENLPVYLDGRGKNIETIREQAAALIKVHDIDIVAFDYLQEFRTRQRHQDERVKFREIAGQMRVLTKEHNKAGIILSQITVQDGKKYPDKHSIRESRDVSNAAEVVALGFTPEQDIVKDGEVIVPAGTRCIKIDKAKDGRKKTVAMAWDDKSACFNAVWRPACDDVDEYANLDSRYGQ